jgi:hypothetical protein
MDPVSITSLIGIGLIILKHIWDIFKEHKDSVEIKSDCCSGNANYTGK